jgi:hypothetical protein
MRRIRNRSRIAFLFQTDAAPAPQQCLYRPNLMICVDNHRIARKGIQLLNLVKGFHPAPFAHLSGNRWALWWAVTRQLSLIYQETDGHSVGRNPATLAHLSGNR